MEPSWEWRDPRKHPRPHQEHSRGLYSGGVGWGDGDMPAREGGAVLIPGTMSDSTDTQHTTQLPQKASLLFPQAVFRGSPKGRRGVTAQASQRPARSEPTGLLASRVPQDRAGSPRPGPKPRHPRALWISSGPGGPGVSPGPLAARPGDSAQGLHPPGTLPGQHLERWTVVVQSLGLAGGEGGAARLAWGAWSPAAGR